MKEIETEMRKVKGETEPSERKALDEWARARRFVEAATLFQRASLAAQVMAGLVLDDLKKGFPHGGGRANAGRRLFPAQTRAKASSPQHADLILLPVPAVGEKRETWEQAIRERRNISPDTAARWMEMGRAARTRLGKGDIELGAILEKHPGALTAAEQELLKRAVRRISDGRTQMEFMLECGSVREEPSEGRRRAGESGAAATKGKPRADTGHFLNARAGLVQTKSLSFWHEEKPDGTPHFTPAQKAEVIKRLGEALAAWPVAVLSAAAAEAKLLLNQKK
jgi:hypothetical protein